jgi:hypothetical protein
MVTYVMDAINTSWFDFVVSFLKETLLWKVSPILIICSFSKSSPLNSKATNFFLPFVDLFVLLVGTFRSYFKLVLLVFI